MFRLNTTNLCFLGVILFLVAVVIYLYTNKNVDGKENIGPETPKHVVKAVVNPGVPTQRSNEPCMTLFHADWCPHCKHLLPVWEEIKKAVNNQHQLADVESKNPMMAEHTLKGFPTVRYFPQGMANSANYVDYEGDRTPQSILQFLSSQKLAASGNPPTVPKL
jgi:thiol-disulfide isomerase/thioredoxin